MIASKEGTTLMINIDKTLAFCLDSWSDEHFLSFANVSTVGKLCLRGCF